MRGKTGALLPTSMLTGAVATAFKERRTQLKTGAVATAFKERYA